MKTWMTILGVGWILFMVTGCSTPLGHVSQKLATGPKPFHSYGLPLYATANVPFEYEELAVVRSISWLKFNSPPESSYMDDLIKNAKDLGADAIVGFHIVETIPSGDFWWMVRTEAQGVAVKIKKP